MEAPDPARVRIIDLTMHMLEDAGLLPTPAAWVALNVLFDDAQRIARAENAAEVRRLQAELGAVGVGMTDKCGPAA